MATSTTLTNRGGLIVYLFIYLYNLEVYLSSPLIKTSISCMTTLACWNRFVGLLVQVKGNCNATA